MMMRRCDTVTCCTKPATWRRLLDHYEASRNTQAACDEHKDERLGWVKIMPDVPEVPAPPKDLKL